jgi:hypothetical protein
VGVLRGNLAYQQTQSPAFFSLLPAQVVEEPVPSDRDEPGDRIRAAVIRVPMAECVEKGQLGQLLGQAPVPAAAPEEVGVDAASRDVIPRPESSLVREDRLELRSPLRTLSRFHLPSRVGRLNVRSAG